VLQCVAVCCSVLQCVAVCCSELQCVAVCCNVLQCDMTHRVPPSPASRYEILESQLAIELKTKKHCNTRQLTATHCNTHTKHYNTLQNTATTLKSQLAIESAV